MSTFPQKHKDRTIYQFIYQQNTKCCCNAACVQQVVLWRHAYLPFWPWRSFQDRNTWNSRTESWTCLSFNCCSSCLCDGASVRFWFWFGVSEPFWLNKDETAEVLLPQWCDNAHPLKALMILSSHTGRFSNIHEATINKTWMEGMRKAENNLIPQEESSRTIHRNHIHNRTGPTTTSHPYITAADFLFHIFRFTCSILHVMWPIKCHVAV